MDHADAVELIELAAVEPEGLERLMAGDTPESVIVAGHLAGCPACVAELARIRRSAAAIREVIVEQPDPALRARTLALVREVGRDRAAAATAGASGPSFTLAGLQGAGERPSPFLAPAAAWEPRTEPGTGPASGSAPITLPDAARRAARPRWTALVGLAAALLVAVGLGFGASRLTTPPDQAAGREIAVLQLATEATLRLDAQPDTQRVALTATGAGAGSAGTLLFSPSTGELVMVASGLAGLQPGQEYGCWLETDGVRRRIGKMYSGGYLESWAGPVEGLADLPPDAVFGVSLVPAGGGAGDPVLTGRPSAGSGY